MLPDLWWVRNDYLRWKALVGGGGSAGGGGGGVPRLVQEIVIVVREHFSSLSIL